MRLKECFTKPSVIDDEYAKQVLELKISLPEVLSTLGLFVIPFIVYFRNFIKLLENSRIRLRPKKFTRIPPAVRWGHVPRRYF